MISYAVTKTTSAAGTISVYVERVDTERDNPDSWGNGPIVEVMIASNLSPTNTEAIARAIDEARKIADEKNNSTGR